MSKMNQKFIEEYDNDFTTTIEDFIDEDYHYKQWLLKIQSEKDKSLIIEDLDE